MMNIPLFWFIHTFKGDNWLISLFEKTLTLAFSWTPLKPDFSNLIITLLGVYIVIVGWWPWLCFKVTDVPRMLTANCKFWILVLCSLNVVWLLIIIMSNFAQDGLCGSGVYSMEIINIFSLVRCLGLLKTLTLGFTQTS